MFQTWRIAFRAILALIALTLGFFWKILLTNLILGGVDAFLYFYPYKSYVTEALRQGRLPLWNPHLFMGVPLLANSQVGLFYPPNWIFLWLDAPKQIAWSIGLHIALAAIFMLAFTRVSLELSWPAALAAAIVFAFGGYLGAQVEHINQLQAAAWLPLLFLLYDLTCNHSRRWLWLLLMALVIALTLLAGHAQTVFISLFGLGLCGLWQAIGEFANGQMANWQLFIQNSKLKTQNSKLLIRRLWPLAFAAILAAALAAIQLLPTVELSGHSIRSQGLTFQEVVSFSLKPTTLHYTLLPPFGLDPTQILGEAFGEWIAYLGISGLMLALLGLFNALWQPLARPFVFVVLCGLGLSFGLFLGPLFLFDVYIGVDSDIIHTLAYWTHPYYLLYKFVPGFALFRVPARWLLLYSFGMAVLAGFGLEALSHPETLCNHLAIVRNWLNRHKIWRLVLIVLPTFILLILFILNRPPLTTLITWIILALLTCTIIFCALHTKHITYSSFIIHHSFILLPLLITELFWAAQALNYNQPTAPQAYTSARNTIAFLLAADPPGQTAPPDRFLSLSGITYDPGDLTDLQFIYGDRLSEKGLYNLVVATKEKEVLFFNLPLAYKLHSVDGYDGGLLPLAQFITLQQLFLPPDDLSKDGRLREKLRFVPNNRLLSLLNARWIITDKQFDAWIDGIFYDLQFPARLSPGQSISPTDIPDFPPTAIGLVSHLEGGADIPTGATIAQVTVAFAGGQQDTLELKAGIDTAEGAYPAGAAHPQAKIGVAWPYAGEGVDYIAVHPLSTSQQIQEITVETTLPTGLFVLRGLSLIHRPTITGRSVILSTEGHYRQAHSGDVKVYENLSVLPRAFIVHQTQIVNSDEQAIAIMKDPQFDPAQTVVRVPQGDEQTGLVIAGQPSTQDIATIISYRPERVEMAVQLNSDGWLVLTDAYYPGWQATVDGQPVDILPVNILFRAVAVPAGEHRVIFEFKPGSFKLGAYISGVSLAVVLAGLMVMSIKRKRPQTLTDF